MPDCSFQIHWKSIGSLLSFKELPNDIITVYKKDEMLRIDYHIDSMTPSNGKPFDSKNLTKGKHFTILIKAG